MFSSGKFLLNNEDIPKKSESAVAKIRAKQIGFVKQDFALIEEYSALDNVMLPLYPIKAQNKKKKTLSALEKMGIKSLAEKEVRTLSGGEKQRVAIARAIANKLSRFPTGKLFRGNQPVLPLSKITLLSNLKFGKKRHYPPCNFRDIPIFYHQSSNLSIR